MVNTLQIAAAGWGFVVMSWLVSPLTSLIWNKLVAYFAFDPSRKLWELEMLTIPDLRLMLGVVEQRRMGREAEDKQGHGGSDHTTLQKIEENLKFALYEAQDILDLVDYHQIEKNLVREDGEQGGSGWFQHLLGALGACVTWCKGTWLWRCIRDSVCQCANGLCWLGAALCRSVEQLPISQRSSSPSGEQLPIFQRSSSPPVDHQVPVSQRSSSTSGEQPSISQRLSNPEQLPISLRPSSPSIEQLPSSKRPSSSQSIEQPPISQRHSSPPVAQLPASQRPSGPFVQKLRAWSHSLDIKTPCRSMHRWLANKYAAACYYRDWSYEVVGIKIIQKKDDIGRLHSFLYAIDGKSLRTRIEDIENIINDSKKSYMLKQDSSGSEVPIKDTNKESSSRQEEIDDLHRSIKWEVFGRDKEREQIRSILREGPADSHGASSSSTRPYSVIGIHGVKGSGKSTLAQYVCDHERQADDKHFDLIVFSDMSRTFRVDKIFLDMLEVETERWPSDTRGPKTLQKDLKKKLQVRGRFLLVLDDLRVSNENQKERDILLAALDAGQSGSVILVTAQREDAAAALGAQKQISIPDLKDKDYLSLLMHHARPFAINDDDRGEYERIGRKIASKLHKSPIAAVTVGKQLRRKTRISSWETIANNDVLNETMGALWWCYQQLGGAEIRQCFAYCSTFPRGYKLKRDELIRIWIAQGFVSNMNDATEELEDVGERYVDELLTFSFLQAQRTIYSFETKRFTIHDLLHELAERIAGSDFHRIDSDGSQKDIPPRVHHLFIETHNATEIAENYLDMGNLHTMIIKEHCTEMDCMQPMDVTTRNHDLEKLFESLFTRLTKLRVLIVEINRMINVCQNNLLHLSFPASVDQMKHLRYLGFHHNSGIMDVVLPSTFNKLYHIQTIDISPVYSKVTCAEDMANQPNLIHLRHIVSARLSLSNVGRLTSLQTPINFEIKEGKGYELKQLRHLNKLRGTLFINGLQNVGSREEALEAHLASKKRITKLLLWFSDTRTRVPDVEAEAEVLEDLCPPKDLEELDVSHYNGSKYPSWMLSQEHPDALKRLRKLSLHFCSRLVSIPEDSELFIHLLELDISYCDWDSLPENMERLMSLKNLSILGCDKMELLPALPQSLQSIFIGWCDVLSVTCEEEGHENWHKIQHIPIPGRRIIKK